MSYHSFIECISCGAKILSGKSNCPYCEISLSYIPPSEESLEWLKNKLEDLRMEIYNRFEKQGTVKDKLSYFWFLIPMICGFFGFVATFNWYIFLAILIILSPNSYLLYANQKESAEYYEFEIIEYTKKEILPALYEELSNKGLSQNDLIEAIRLATSQKSSFAHSNLCYLIYE